MGGEFPVGGSLGGTGPCVAEAADAVSPPGESLASLALSTRRARRASHARLSSPLRSASITAVPGGLGGVGGDGGGDVSLPAREVVVLGGPEPRWRRTTVHPPSSPGGEVWVAAVVWNAAAGCGAGGADRSGGTPGPVTTLSPKDCRREIS